MDLDKLLGFWDKIFDLSLDKLIILSLLLTTSLLLTLIAIRADTLDDLVVIVLEWVMRPFDLVDLLINQAPTLTISLFLTLIAI